MAIGLSACVGKGIEPVVWTSFNNKMERNHGCSAQLNCSRTGDKQNSPSSGLSERTLVRLDDRGII